MALADSSKTFLGVGWSFPISDSNHEVATVGYEENIRQAILIILQTRRGERIMRPDFGAGLSDFLFEPVNPTTMALVKTRVQEALIDWEPRIDVEDVTVGTSDQRNALLIDVRYRVRASNTVRNLVYPFYLSEGASE